MLRIALRGDKNIALASAIHLATSGAKIRILRIVGYGFLELTRGPREAEGGVLLGSFTPPQHGKTGEGVDSRAV